MRIAVNNVTMKSPVLKFTSDFVICDLLSFSWEMEHVSLLYYLLDIVFKIDQWFLMFVFEGGHVALILSHLTIQLEWKWYLQGRAHEALLHPHKNSGMHNCSAEKKTKVDIFQTLLKKKKKSLKVTKMLS